LAQLISSTMVPSGNLGARKLTTCRIEHRSFRTQNGELKEGLAMTFARYPRV
jgi:hypothetical protein